MSVIGFMLIIITFYKLDAWYFPLDARRDFSKTYEVYNYTWQMFLGGCRFWNAENETWSSEGCVVSSSSPLNSCVDPENFNESVCGGVLTTLF